MVIAGGASCVCMYWFTASARSSGKVIVARFIDPIVSPTGAFGEIGVIGDPTVKRKSLTQADSY